MANWINDKECLWHRGVIPYSIDTKHFPKDSGNNNTIKDAMNWIQENTNIAFKEYNKKTDDDYILFTYENDADKIGACNSPVGRQGGKQKITCFGSTANGSGITVTKSVIIHEIGHALGLYHEQSRPDRDNYIDIDFNNIEEDFKHNFDIDGKSLLEYDYSSIMHYSQNSFGKDKSKKVITSKSSESIKPSEVFSPIDILALNYLYNSNVIGRHNKKYRGRFTQGLTHEILFYNSVTDSWWLSKQNIVTLKLEFIEVSETSGFGNLKEKRIWMRKIKFSNSDRDEILFYNNADGHWWLGSFFIDMVFDPIKSAVIPKDKIKWQLVNDSSNFGDLKREDVKMWVGNFTQKDREEILLYSSTDGDWWVGKYDLVSKNMSWTWLNNTDGFGSLLRDAIRINIGKYSQPDLDEVLFYHQGDGNWYLSKFILGSGFIWELQTRFN